MTPPKQKKAIRNAAKKAKRARLSHALDQNRGGHSTTALKRLSKSMSGHAKISAGLRAGGTKRGAHTSALPVPTAIKHHDKQAAIARRLLPPGMIMVFGKLRKAGTGKAKRK